MAYITVKNAKVHNLKSISTQIPHNKLIAITGISGSGKSSFAIDMLFAEGQRKYIESLSSYARQFLGKLNKPNVDEIIGIPPAIAIEQKVISKNPRSTVGTSSEIYDYLKLLFARIGKTYSPISGKKVIKHTPETIIDYIKTLSDNTQIILLSKILHSKENTANSLIEFYTEKGFNRLLVKNKIIKVKDLIINKVPKKDLLEAYVVIDRFYAEKTEDNLSRIYDSLETAFGYGEGKCYLQIDDNKKLNAFSNGFEADDIKFEEPNVHLFNFNSPYGACNTCNGYGSVLGIDPDLVVPNKDLSIYEGAIACWKGEKMNLWNEALIKNAHHFDFPIHRPYYLLTEEERNLLWTGNKYFDGLKAFFKHIEEKSYKIAYRVLLSRYRGKTVCPECRGARLRKEAGYVKICNKTILDLVLMPINDLYNFFLNIKLNNHEQTVAKHLLTEIISRIKMLKDVGLGYLSLNRGSNTLSGGESQRIQLAKSIGSSLVGSLYILDEPSIGLHPRDTQQLISVLKKLKDIGNTVLIVEHDEDIIRAADYIIDFGPLAGTNGGEIVFQGKIENINTAKNSLTADYLTFKKTIPLPNKIRKWNSYIEVINAHSNNLKFITAKFPLHILVAVSGVSGSGKSTLVKQILYPALKKYKQEINNIECGKYDKLGGDLNNIDAIELIDQNPIGKSSRSNPVTYVKAFDDIRMLFARQKTARYNGFTASYFSFNVTGGRCENCKGEGFVTIEMQFMADVKLICEECNGKRFNEEVLEITFQNKNIYDVLEMTIDEAIAFFSENNTALCNTIVQKMQPLSDVGLGYLKLGQSSSTLSGGEAQRIKLASFLGKAYSDKHILFLFDEPTTGLHFQDINKLLNSFNALIDNGHSIIVIEHNLEVLKSADWLIDLGPEGGNNGGEIIFEGIPKDACKNSLSYTGKHLKNKF